MGQKDDIAARPEARAWTRPDDYVAAMARRRTARRSRERGPRTQPEAPRFSLSTLPFLALMLGLAVLTVAIMVAAWPGGGAQREIEVAAKEPGTAAKGWFQQAEREFR